MAQTTGNTQLEMDLFLAKAQVAMSFLFIFGIFGLVILLVLWHDTISSTTLTIITSIIAALVTVLTLQQNFFFARQRPNAGSPPTAPTLNGVFNADNPPTTATLTVSAKPAPPGAPGTSGGAST